jgi:hypothetical protein
VLGVVQKVVRILWTYKCELYVWISCEEQQAVDTYLWQHLPKRYLSIAQTYFNKHLAGKKWFVDAVHEVRYGSKEGYEYLCSWKGFDPSCHHWQPALSVSAEVVADAWELECILKTRKHQGKVQVYGRHKLDRSHTCDYWYDMDDIVVTAQVKAAWKAKRKQARKEFVLENGGVCLYDIEGLHVHESNDASSICSEETQEDHSALPCERQLFQNSWAGMFGKRLWTVMVVDRVRQPKLPTHVPMELYHAFIHLGRFLGGDMCHLLKVSWVNAELEETRQVNDNGLLVETEEIEPTPMVLPSALNIEDLREDTPNILDDEEADQAALNVAKDATEENKIKKIAYGYQISWTPVQAAILFGFDPHTWRPVRSPHFSTKWYRLNNEKDIIAEWFDDILIFTNLHIQCADTEVSPGGMERPRKDPLIAVPLKRKHFAALPPV